MLSVQLAFGRHLRTVSFQTCRALAGRSAPNNLLGTKASSVPHPERSVSTTCPKFSEAVEINHDFDNHPSRLKEKFRKRLAEAKAQSMLGGGMKRIEKQHARGSLTARERLELLFDPGTFYELDSLKLHRCTEFGMEKKQFPGDGIVTGHGLINGRVVYAFSQGKRRRRIKFGMAGNSW